MYKCKPEQISHWTDEHVCTNWLFYKGRNLNCAAYVANGQCNTDKTPCCGCWKDNWNQNLLTRYYHTHSLPSECKDEITEKFGYKRPVCSSWKRNGFCSFGVVKAMCEKSCDICTSRRRMSLLDTITRSIKIA
jgi:hypothetical protein